MPDDPASDDYLEVPPEVLARLRPVCLGLPEAYEEQAWVGTRWRVRKKTFAHVLRVTPGRPPVHAKEASVDGPSTVLIFRSHGPELSVLTDTGYPFYRPQWGRDVVGMILHADVDWTEVAELVTESYCVQAPRKLVRLVDRPGV
ncbi:MmcQ/YjbR family DNA-binding protein [Actinophytocola sp.]|uniref:MmcQ/YjbR family DNA-binding protein n=1 Tax=Actinophytocola sp. TaxID=1872138 RepID=UPI003D6B0A82